MTLLIPLVFVVHLCFCQGRAIFASGSPFAPVEYDGKVFVPGQVPTQWNFYKCWKVCHIKWIVVWIFSFFVIQSNNAYIFPGFGLGLIMSGTIRVHDDLLLAACKCIRDSKIPFNIKLNWDILWLNYISILWNSGGFGFTGDAGGLWQGTHISAIY
jgi:hypothetical protein